MEFTSVKKAAVVGNKRNLYGSISKMRKKALFFTAPVN